MLKVLLGYRFDLLIMSNDCLTHLVKFVVGLSLLMEAGFLLTVAGLFCGYYSECIFLGPKTFSTAFLLDRPVEIIILNLQRVNQQDSIFLIHHHFVLNRA